MNAEPTLFAMLTTYYTHTCEPNNNPIYYVDLSFKIDRNKTKHVFYNCITHKILRSETPLYNATNSYKKIIIKLSPNFATVIPFICFHDESPFHTRTNKITLLCSTYEYETLSTLVIHCLTNAV